LKLTSKKLKPQLRPIGGISSGGESKQGGTRKDCSEKITDKGDEGGERKDPKKRALGSEKKRVRVVAYTKGAKK